MVVTADAIHGTIGGGHLEYKAIDIARGLIAERRRARRCTASRWARASASAAAASPSCCSSRCAGLPPWLDALVRLRSGRHRLRAGHAVARRREPRSGSWSRATSAFGTLGSARTLDREATALARARASRRRRPTARSTAAATPAVECFVDVVRPPDFRVVLFGAGHVGRAIVHALAGIRCRITWVDTRDDEFPSALPGNVECVVTDAPEAEVAAAPAGAYFLVMTHSHAAGRGHSPSASSRATTSPTSDSSARRRSAASSRSGWRRAACRARASPR